MFEAAIVEKRKDPRVNAHLVVSYLQQDGEYKFDISQAKNISAGGMLLTSCKPFTKDVFLALKVRLPLLTEPVALLARVLESREVMPGVIYDNRLKFQAIDEADRVALKDTLQVLLGRAKIAPI